MGTSIWISRVALVIQVLCSTEVVTQQILQIEVAMQERSVHTLLQGNCVTDINPLSTTGLPTPFLIGSYHELFTYLANHYKALKM